MTATERFSEAAFISSREDDVPRVSAADKKALRSLLATGQFARLEDELEKYRLMATQDIGTGEAALIQAYQSFSVDSIQNSIQLNAWAHERPQSHQAYTARAYYHLHAALSPRGTEFRPEKSGRSSRSLELASTDARIALRIQPQNAAPYRVLIDVSRNGQGAPLRDVVAEAVKAFPADFNLHAQALEALQPLSADNYDLMKSLAQDAQKHTSQNPRLRVLMGYPSWAAGNVLAAVGKHASAMDAYTLALSYGDHADFFMARSRTAMAAGQYGVAVADAQWADKLAPPDDPQHALLPEVVNAAWSEASARYRGGDLKGAVELYNLIIGAAPADEGDARVWRGAAACRMGDTEAGISDLRAAISLEPSSYTALYQLADCLDDVGRIGEMIPSFQKLISASADGQVKGYTALGRVYVKLKMRNEAASSLRKACSLGNRDVCAYAAKYEHKPVSY